MTPALTWDGQSLRLLDQTLLPGEETWIGLEGAADTAAAIARLAVRGAPNIGIAAAYGLAMAIARAAGDDEVREAAALLREARKPVLYVGGGVIKANAHEALFALAEASQAPLTTTLMARGAFPDDHPLALGMPGMHGNYAAVAALQVDPGLLGGQQRLVEQAQRAPVPAHRRRARSFAGRHGARC